MTLAAGVAATALAGAVVSYPAAATPAQSGLLHEVAHKHVHMDGHKLLGANLKHDGKHAVGTLKGKAVTATVKGGKVTGTAAGDLPVKQVKSNKKMVLQGGGVIRAAYLQSAQYEEVYYAYCFDDGYDYTCYWYPASDVFDPSGADWLPYDPTY
jgi:hypothetical protein